MGLGIMGCRMGLEEAIWKQVTEFVRGNQSIEGGRSPEVFGDIISSPPFPAHTKSPLPCIISIA